MKRYILLIILFTSGYVVRAQVINRNAESNGKIHKLKNHHIERYFLIGFIAGTSGGSVFDGGTDTIMTRFPNYKELSLWLTKKYRITGVRIVSICEMSKEDFYTFWDVKKLK